MMNMKAMLLSLTIISLSLSMGIAEPLQVLSRGGTVLTGPCTLYMRIAHHVDGTSDESWACYLHPADGNGFVDVNNLDLTSAVSGETTLFAPNMTVSDNAVVIPDPTRVVFGEARRRDRRLTMTGNKQVVVVRVTCGTKVVSKSLTDIKFDVFSDAVCLKSQMAACSNNILTISEGPSTGGVEASITDCADVKAAEQAVTAALATTFGNVSNIADTYFMYCMPAGVFNASGTAYAYVNGRISVYNDAWCFMVSAQMHEIGHNLNLAHANQGGVEYNDKTGLMGFSYLEDDTPLMCFNGPNSFQLGWLNNVSDVTANPDPNPIVLVGHMNFGGGLQAVRLQGTPTAGQDTYIWFNHAFGIHAGTREGMDQVIVNTRPSGLDAGPSVLEAKLGVGASYAPSGAYYSVQVLSIGNGQATITFGNGSPTNAPVPTTPLPAPVVPTPLPAPVVPTPLPAPVVPTPLPAPVVPIAASHAPIYYSSTASCPKTKRRKECPSGCTFKKNKCKKPKKGALVV